jgi:hypothetical protein
MEKSCAKVVIRIELPDGLKLGTLKQHSLQTIIGMLTHIPESTWRWAISFLYPHGCRLPFMKGTHLEDNALSAYNLCLDSQSKGPDNMSSELEFSAI